MSIPVSVQDLAAKTEEYAWAYLLTVREDSRPQINAVSPTWTGGALTMSVGRGTAANATARPSITMCYPPIDIGGYSLIIDGEATVNDAVVTFVPTGAVLHRPAAEGFTGSATGCANDCAQVEASGA